MRRVTLPAALLDVCFPPRCLVCGQASWDTPLDGLCTDCARQLPPPAARCGACGRRCGPRQPPTACARCAGPAAERDALRWSGDARHRGRRALRGVVAAWSYGGVPRELVLALKFHGRPEAAGPLAAGMCEALRAARVPGDLLVPVPLSRRRRRRRGYDQARLLAARLARALELDLALRLLRRTRHTRPQSGLAPGLRADAPRGAFRARPGPADGRCVLLVDDVLTSGGTARACAAALRAAGARRVTAVVACRAERGRPA